MNKQDVHYHKESMAISWLFGTLLMLTYFGLFAIIEEVKQGDLGGIIAMCIAITFLLFMDWRLYGGIKNRVEFLDAVVSGEEQ